MVAIRYVTLTLSLLVLRVLADNHDMTFSLDDLALVADLLNGWFYFHVFTMPFSQLSDRHNVTRFHTCRRFISLSM